MLKVRKLNSTQYLDAFILLHMGIYDVLIDLLKSCGLPNWVNMWHLTHKLLTYEFLSSVGSCQHEGRLQLTFRFRNASYYFDYASFFSFFYLAHKHALEKQPDNARIFELCLRLLVVLFSPIAICLNLMYITLYNILYVWS